LLPITAMALGTMERLPNSHMMRDSKLSKDPNPGQIVYGILHADNINSDDNLSKVLHMTSGSGDNSYAHNSNRQGSVFKVVQPAFCQLIQSFPIQNHGLLRIADLGCATGMNTVSEVDFVVKTLKSMCAERSLALPELQVFFNDLPSNDFNGLFLMLNKQNLDYFATGVPRSFYNVLFPRGSIHICFSVMALHWLSQVPAVVEKESSPVYNRGKVWINGNSAEIAKAYAEQSQKDLRQFFGARAHEMESGGVMFLCAMGRPNSAPAEHQVSIEGEYCGADFEAAWDDLISEGIVGAESRDSFNLPWYFPNAEEVREAIEASSAFEISRLEVLSGVCCMREEDFKEWVRDAQSFGKMKSNLVRSFIGSLVEQKIGSEKADALFHRLESRSGEFLEKKIIYPSRYATCVIAALVKK
jgi:hypothetical protein